MKCPKCGATLLRTAGYPYCPICKETVEPPDPLVGIGRRTATGLPAGSAQKVFAFIALVIPLIFLALPQASCGGLEEFNGLGLLQALTDKETSEGIGALVIVAAFVLAGVCVLAGVTGLIGLLSSGATNFSPVGGIGLGGCLLVLIAKGDKSLQGGAIELEIGYYLIMVAFIILLASNWVSSALGHTDLS